MLVFLVAGLSFP
ncbi:hypothetical protein LINGRAHAP2_LOCUS25923 [Linum grandiflorum]